MQKALSGRIQDWDGEADHRKGHPLAGVAPAEPLKADQFARGTILKIVTVRAAMADREGVHPAGRVRS